MNRLICSNCNKPFTSWLIGVSGPNAQGQHTLYLKCQQCRCVAQVVVTTSQVNQLQHDGALLKEIDRH